MNIFKKLFGLYSSEEKGIQDAERIRVRDALDIYFKEEKHSPQIEERLRKIMMEARAGHGIMLNNRPFIIYESRGTTYIDRVEFDSLLEEIANKKQSDVS